MRRTFSRFHFFSLLIVFTFSLGWAGCSGDSEISPSQELKAFCAFVYGQGNEPGNLWLGGSDGLLLKSTDEGQNFSRIDAGFNYAINDLSFSPDGQYGYAVGPDGMYAGSNDFGNNWTVQMLGVNTNPNLHGLTWAPLNDQVGWIVGDAGSIYHTADRGVTWDLQDSKTSENLYGTCFTDTQKGFAVGDNGTILNTSDGGQNWDKKNSGVGVNLRYCFRDLDFGLVVGYGGTALRTDDSGDTWNPQTTGVNNDLYTLAVKPDFSGVVLAGGEGVIIRSMDFGNSWETVYDEIEAGFLLILKKLAFALSGPNVGGVGYTGMGQGFDFGMVPGLLPSGEEPLTDGLAVESQDDGKTWVQVGIKLQF